MTEVKPRTEYMRQHRENNKEHYKQYYENNKERQLAKQKERVICSQCNCNIPRHNYYRHQKTQKCLNIKAQLYPEP